MWFLEEWQPRSPTHNGARAFRLRGTLDRDALQQAFTHVVERHQILRTVVELVAGEPVQVPLANWSLELPLIELPSEPGATTEAQLNALLAALSREPFDLRHDLMIRTTLVQLARDDHVLLIRLHHIAFDGFSDSVLFDELSNAYGAYLADQAPKLPPLSIQYADFAAWQRAELQGDKLQTLLDYWRRELDGAPPHLPLPTDRPRQQVQRHEGTRRPFRLEPSTATALTELARSEGVTLFMALEAFFAILLYRLSGCDDIVVGTPIANRNHAQLTGLIGLFSNTVPLRNRLGGNPNLREVLQRTKETTLGALAHQELPFEKLVEALHTPRDPAYNPVFQVNFRTHAGQRAKPTFHDVDASPLFVDIGFSRFDLSLELQAARDGINGYLEYDHDLYNPESSKLIINDLRRLLLAGLADPDTPILTLPPPAQARATRTRHPNSGPRPAPRRRNAD
jgi:hypothetical protein